LNQPAIVAVSFPQRPCAVACNEFAIDRSGMTFARHPGGFQQPNGWSSRDDGKGKRYAFDRELA
jgi:hypothetical protein